MESLEGKEIATRRFSLQLARGLCCARGWARGLCRGLGGSQGQSASVLVSWRLWCG